MKDKVAITRENYKQIILKRAIISCWVILIVCFIIKLFGGNFFAIVCNDEKFIRVCDYIENSFVKYIIYYLLFMFTYFNFFIIVNPMGTIKSKYIFVYIFYCTILWLIKLLFEVLDMDNLIVYNIFTCCFTYLILILYTKKYKNSLIIIIYDFILAIVSVITKNIGLSNILTDSFLITIIFSIDYYIMLLLTSLYRKYYIRRANMGLIGIWSWLGEEVEKLKAIKALTKDEKVIKAIDERIEELEAKKEEE